MHCSVKQPLKTIREGVSALVILMAAVLFWGGVFPHAAFAGGSIAPSMKGPPALHGHKPSAASSPTSCVQIAFIESIRVYQKWISPIGGDRCGFRPSCSRYGYAAITSQGPVVGLMMTGDRLMRCNIWKKPGADYYLLPNGRLFDPLSDNLLFDP